MLSLNRNNWSLWIQIMRDTHIHGVQSKNREMFLWEKNYREKKWSKGIGFKHYRQKRVGSPLSFLLSRLKNKNGSWKSVEKHMRVFFNCHIHQRLVFTVKYQPIRSPHPVLTVGEARAVSGNILGPSWAMQNGPCHDDHQDS